MKKILKLTTLAAAICSLVIVPARAGTVTISATGLSSSPIFVTSGLGSLTVGTELNIGHFYDSSALTSIINAYKAGVTGTGNTLAEAQTDAASKSNLLYTSTVNWLSNASNFKSLPAAANSVSQTGGAAGKFLFASSANRTVNGVSATYAGATGTMDVTYSTYGNALPLWAWIATGSQITIVTDSTWVIPSSPTAGLTIGSAALSNGAFGTPANSNEILLGSYVDYNTGSDLVAAASIAETLNVVPEPSTGALIMLGAAGLVALRRLRKV
jgi:hypothetical protein